MTLFWRYAVQTLDKQLLSLLCFLFVYGFYQSLSMNVWIQIGDANIFRVLSNSVVRIVFTPYLMFYVAPTVEILLSNLPLIYFALFNDSI